MLLRMISPGTGYRKCPEAGLSSRLVRRTPQFVLVNRSGDPRKFSCSCVSHHATPAEELDPCTGSGQEDQATDWCVRTDPRWRKQKQPIATEVHRVRLCFPMSPRTCLPANEHWELHREADCGAAVSHAHCTLTQASLTQQARHGTSTTVLEVASCPEPLLRLPVRPEGLWPSGLPAAARF